MQQVQIKSVVVRCVNMKIFGLFLSAVLVYAQSQQDCGKNAEWDSCGTACPETCFNLNKKPEICTKQCVQGCFCKKNYYKNYAGDCVKAAKCSSCPANSTYSGCGLNCQKTCDPQPQYFAPCTENCHIDGCNCNEGFVLSHDTNTCILESDCPLPDCGKNAEWDSCGTACPVTCFNLNKKAGICTKQCVQGCFCKKNYYKNYAGDCVKAAKCSSCPANSTYSGCGLNCQKTCDPQPQYFAPCTENCHIDGCNCNEGFVLSHDTNTCLLESDCPLPDCPRNTTFSSCAPCEQSCNSPRKLCPLYCLESGGSCVCADGFVRGPDGNCILSSDCPKIKKCH